MEPPLATHPNSPVDEIGRQRALDSFRIVDSLPEKVYDDLVRVAATLCGTPIALVSLVDRDRQWFKARVGLDVAQTPRSIAVCDHAIRTPGQLFEVPDLGADPRFAGNPLVTDDPRIRFYAGMPLVTNDGHAIGTVCVIDHCPRELNDEQRAALQALGRIAMTLISECAPRRRESQHRLHAESGLAHARGASFVAAIIELQDHAGLVERMGMEAAESLLATLEEQLHALLPRDAMGAVQRNPGSAECTLVLEGAADTDSIVQRVGDAIEQLGDRQGVRILFGAATSYGGGERMEEVFLRADDALALAKDASVKDGAAVQYSRVSYRWLTATCAWFSSSRQVSRPSLSASI